MKKIDLNWPVQKLCTEYPEIVEILRDLGFTEIVKPAMQATVGRFMTIPKGAAMKKLDMDIIKRTLTERGFEVTYEKEEEG